MAKDDKLPKTLYVKRTEDGDMTYLEANEDYSELAILNDVVTVGKYKLQREVEISAWPTTDEDD